MAPMMVERHYDDEALIALMESGREESDAHLPSCTVCRDKLESFGMIAGALHDRDVWDTRPLHADPLPATITSLRAFADRMAAEDAAAESILPELLAGPRDTWMPRLRAHPEWRTAGVVRGLIAATNRAIDTMPPDAVALTTLATDIADHLDTTTHPSDTVHRLRGAAWRERGYALFYTGDFASAERAVERAERAFRMCRVADYEQARTGIVKTLVLRTLERFDEAKMVASASADTFSEFDDLSKLVSARIAETHLLFSRGDYASAEAILCDLDRRLVKAGHVETHARVLANLGYCARRMGKPDVALGYFEFSSGIFDELGIRTEAVRLRWNAAAMLAETGRLTDAYERLQAITIEMESLGMTSEAALNALEIAELLLAEERYAEVEQLCRNAMQSFERAGLQYTTRAMTALAYIREAAQHRVASQALVREVREYIRHLPSQPNLLFAPPPLPPGIEFSKSG